MKRVLCGIFLALLLMIPVPQAAAQNEAILKFERFLQDYYKNPDPDKVPGHMLNLIDTEYFESGDVFRQNRQLLYAYAFGRMAEEEPSLIPIYTKIFEKTTPQGRAFLVNVFQVCGNDEVVAFLKKVKDQEAYKIVQPIIDDALGQGIPLAFDPLKNEIDIPYDIEMLWAEYFISGNEAAVKRIISKVAEPDIIRQKVENYLRSDADQQDKDLLVERVLRVIGVEIDPETFQATIDTDFGALMMSRIRDQSITAEAFDDLLAQIGMPDDDFLKVTTKAEAVRSLEAYAFRDDKVLKVCQAALGEYDGETKDFLLNLAFRGEFQRKNNAQARDYLMELIARNPDQTLLHAVLAELYLGMDDIEAAANQIDFLSRRDPLIAYNLKRRVELKRLDAWGDAAQAEGEPIEDLTVLISGIKAKSKSVDSYQTHVNLGDEDATVIAWDADYVAPNRYSVEQGLYRPEGILIDKWITIGSDVYRFMGQWVQDGDGVSGLAEISQKLRMDKWTDLFPDKSKITASLLNINGKEIVRLTFVPDFTEGFFAKPIAPDIQEQKATIWVDADNKYIRKARLDINAIDPTGNPVNVVYDQEFFSHGVDLIVEKPARVREMTQKQESPKDEVTQDEAASPVE